MSSCEPDKQMYNMWTHFSHNNAEENIYLPGENITWINFCWSRASSNCCVIFFIDFISSPLSRNSKYFPNVSLDKACEIYIYVKKHRALYDRAELRRHPMCCVWYRITAQKRKKIALTERINVPSIFLTFAFIYLTSSKKKREKISSLQSLFLLSQIRLDRPSTALMTRTFWEIYGEDERHHAEEGKSIYKEEIIWMKCFDEEKRSDCVVSLLGSGRTNDTNFRLFSDSLSKRVLRRSLLKRERLNFAPLMLFKNKLSLGELSTQSKTTSRWVVLIRKRITLLLFILCFFVGGFKETTNGFYSAAYELRCQWIFRLIDEPVSTS